VTGFDACFSLERLWCQRFGITRSQKRIAARTQPSALVPVPSPKPWPAFG
jgi:hypothetical protein